MRAKVCLVGEAGVGKTSLVRRVVFDEYGDRYFPTLGAKAIKKELAVRLGDQTVRIVFVIWDIIGEPSFRQLLADAYFPGTRGLLGVGDLTRPATLRALPAWIDAARGVSGPVPLVLLGNKADLSAEKGADETLAQVGASYAAPHWHTSAKTGENVEAAFASLAKMVANAVLGIATRSPQETAARPVAAKGSRGDTHPSY